MKDSITTPLQDAAWQVLDDMGKDGQGCCLVAKAQLRIALGEISDPDAQLDFTLEAAKEIVEEYA